MSPDEMKFLAEVRERCRGDAHMTEKVIHNAIAGMADRANALKQFASDMEVVAAMALNTKLFKGNEKFLADKLEMTRQFQALNWAEQIAKLRGKK